MPGTGTRQQVRVPHPGPREVPGSGWASVQWPQVQWPWQVSPLAEPIAAEPSLVSLQMPLPWWPPSPSSPIWLLMPSSTAVPPHTWPPLTLPTVSRARCWRKWGDTRPPGPWQ